MSKESTIEMGEYKTNLRAMCSRKRSESDYKSLRMLSYKTEIAKLKLLWMLVFCVMFFGIMFRAKARPFIYKH